MTKNAKGINLNLGPVKQELLNFAQGFGVLTTQLNAFMQSMSQAQRASQQFSTSTSGLSPTAMQTPIGMQTQAAAQNSGFQQVSYAQRFNELSAAAKSGQDPASMGLMRADEDIVRRSRDAMRGVEDMRFRQLEQVARNNRNATSPSVFQPALQAFGKSPQEAQQLAQEYIQSRNMDELRKKLHVGQDMAGLQPIVQQMAQEMRGAGMTPAETAHQIRQFGPDAANAFGSMKPQGLGSSRDYSYFSKAQGMMGMHPEELGAQAVADRQRIGASIQKTNERREQEMLNEQERRREEVKRAFNTSFQTGDQARSANTRAAVTGDNSYKYGLGDIVTAKGNLANSGQTLDQIKAFSDKLKASGDQLDKGLGAEIDKIASKFNQLGDRFDKLNNALQGQEVGSEKYQKTLAELAKTSGQLNQTLDDVKEASKQGGGPGGGGSGGSFGSMSSRIQGFAGIAAAVGGTALAGAQEFFAIRRTMDEASLGSERKTYGAEAEIAQMAFRSRREQADIGDVNNRLKWRAEVMLSPSQLADNPLLGANGRQRALDKAAQETAKALQVQKTNSSDSSAIGIGKVILGGLAAAGAAAVLAPAAGVLAAGGGIAAAGAALGVGGGLAAATGLAGAAGGLMSGFSDFFTGNKENDYNKASQGGLAGSFIGRLMGREGDAEKNKRAAVLGQSIDVLKKTEELRQDALASSPDLVEGWQGLEESRQTQIQGAALIGASSVRGLEGMSAEIGRGRMAGEMGYNRARSLASNDNEVAANAISNASTGRIGAGNLADYRNQTFRGMSRESILYGLQGVESNFGRNTGNHAAKGNYQVLGVVRSKFQHYAAMNGMTEGELYANPDAQNAAMSSVLSTYNPAAFQRRAPGLSATQAIAIEHIEGQNAEGWKAAQAIANGDQNYRDSHGQDVSAYVRKFQSYQAANERISGMSGSLSNFFTKDATVNRAIGKSKGGQKSIREAAGQGNTEVDFDRSRQSAQDSYFDSVFADKNTDYATLRGLSYAQFGQKQNQISNFIGQSSSGGKVASVGMTGEMIDLSRSGFGSMESLMGNLQGLNQTRGGQNNFDSLKEIFASGVTAGFDKSRTAQMFVQSVTGLAQAIGVTNTGDLAKTVSVGAQLGSANQYGVADEKSTADAVQGIAGLASKTGRVTGFLGASKLSAYVRAGATMTSGLGILQGLDISQLSGGVDELSKAQSAADITDPKIRAMVLAKGDGPQAVQEVLKLLQAGKTATLNSSTAITGIYGDKSIQTLRDIDKKDFDKMNPSQRMAKLRELTAKAQLSGAGTSFGFNETGALAAEIIKEKGLLEGQDMDKFAATFKAGTATSRDAAAASSAGRSNRNILGVAANNLVPNGPGGLTGEQASLSQRGLQQVSGQETQSKMGQVLDAATAKAISDAVVTGMGNSKLGSTLRDLNLVLGEIKGKIGK